MTRLLILGGFIFLTEFGQLAHADGLIYQLPKDGTGVTFDVETKQTFEGREVTKTGKFSMRSVGQVTVDGEPCRWIECRSSQKFANFDEIMISKALIPEKHLGKGKSPLDHV